MIQQPRSQGHLSHVTKLSKILTDPLPYEVWGGTDAESLKKEDNIFGETGAIPLETNVYRHKLVGCTSDGASVNFGAKTGLMTRLAVDRPWLVKIHCIIHRVELAVKDAIKLTDFTQVDDFYYGTTFLLKNSGKIKSEIQQAA